MVPMQLQFHAQGAVTRFQTRFYNWGHLANSGPRSLKSASDEDPPLVASSPLVVADVHRPTWPVDTCAAWER